MTTKLTIQNWEESERPREKFLAKGGESLSNAELLAILLRSGNRNENAIDLARNILATANNNLTVLKKFTFEDLKKFNGIGVGKALSILACFELSKRTDMEQTPINAQIYSSKSAAQAVAPILKDIAHEECWVLYLNRGNKLIGKEKVTSGGVSSTIVDVKIIIKKAISKLASSIILVHNHPSGNKTPGDHDKIQTKRLKNAAQMCEIELLDHLIIAGDNYYSFSDEGIL
ncbi:MAG: DNA repair protein RadC [Bacteroidales bacterium]